MASKTDAFEVDDLGNINFKDKILPAAKEHDWTTVKCQLNLYAKSIKCFGTLDNPYKFTVLHYACASNNGTNALKAVKDIFDFMQKFDYSPTQLIDVVNKKDSKGRTPLFIAVENEYDDVVEFLLDNSADVTLLVQKKINDRFHKILIRLFDRGLKLNCNTIDSTNEHLWTIGYNFSAISGIPSIYDPPGNVSLETKTLATILTLPSRKRHDILMHPLVQLFVRTKSKKYSNLIWISICYHILWYLISAVFMIRTINSTVYVLPALSTVATAGVNQTLILTSGTYYKMELKHPVWFRSETGDNFVDENNFKINIYEPVWLHLENDLKTSNQVFEFKIKSVDSIKALLVQNAKFPGQKVYNAEIKFPVEFIPANESILSKQANIDIKNPHPKLFIYVVLPICLLTSLSKEIFELVQSPSKRYYWGQYENLGQWSVLGVSFISIIVPLLGEMPFWIQIFVSFIYSVGIVSSLFLIQSQFTKTEWFGVYNLMMIKSFKKLLKFIVAFTPMLVAYVVVLNTLLPQEMGLTYSWGIGFGVILAMMTGELNYSTTFSADNVKQIPNVLPTVIVFILFILTVVILLQNLLIGLTVSNIERLKKKAIAAHTANRLEVVNLLEAFVVFFMENVYKIDSFLQQYSVIQEIEAGTDFEEDFLNLPKRIQAAIRENKEIYLTGFNQSRL